MNNDIKYFVESAKLLVKGGKLFGKPIDSKNLEEVLAAIYLLYLEESSYYKSLKIEKEFLSNV